MSQSVIQRNFSAGEISPAIYPKVDQVKYSTGLKTLLNGYPKKNGGALNRAGSIWVCETKHPDRKVRLIEWVYSKSITYAIEIGHNYMRFIKNGVQINSAAQPVVSMTNANPGVFEVTGHGFIIGQEVFAENMAGTTGINKKNLIINSVPDANHFTLRDRWGPVFDTTASGTYTGGGQFRAVYEINGTPYSESDLADLKFDQQKNVMVLVHPKYPPYILKNTTGDIFSLTPMLFEPEFTTTATMVSISGTGGAIVNIYAVTAVSAITGEESLPLSCGSNQITNITNAFPAVVTTSAAHGKVTGEKSKMVFTNGTMPQLNGRYFTLKVTGANTFELQGEDTSTYGVFTAGGAATIVEHATLSYSSGVVTSLAPNTITWNDAKNVKQYNVYKELNGAFGLIGISNVLTHKDIGLTPDTSITFPDATNPFRSSGDYPSAVSFSKQRLYLAATENYPERVWGSKIGEIRNFTKSYPLQDDGPVGFQAFTKTASKVQHMFDLNKLILMQEMGEVPVLGGQGGVITPSEVNPDQHSYNGSSQVRPLVVNGDALYVQTEGSIVRDLAFDIQVDGYRGNDLTTFSDHLTEKNTIVDWAYQKTPNSLIWMVRDDGIALSLTRIQEQNILGWARHITRGSYENFCSIPEGNEFAVYQVVKRSFDGHDRRYIERMSSRRIFDVIDNNFLDAALKYDGRNTGSTTMKITGGPTWTKDDLLTVEASASSFSTSDVGKQIHFYDSEKALLVRFSIENYVDATHVTGHCDVDVPAELQDTATTIWALAVKSLSALYHLNGEEVGVFADRFVENNPLIDEEDEIITVEDGNLEISKHHAVIFVGIPYVSDIETLEVDTAQGETMSNKNKLVSKVYARVKDSGSFYVGGSAPSTDQDDILKDLIDLKLRESELFSEATELANGKVDLNIIPEWNKEGQVFIRNVDPLPLELLSVTAEGLFPFKGAA